MLTVQQTTYPHIHDEDLDFYLRGQLEPGHLTDLEPHLSGCDSCKARLAEKIGQDRCLAPRLPLQAPSEGGDKRTEPRFKTGSSAILQEINPLSIERQQAEIVDVSKNGVGIVSPKPILRGTIVQIRIGRTIFLAEVRNCVGSDGRFRIGLRLRREF